MTMKTLLMASFALATTSTLAHAGAKPKIATLVDGKVMPIGVSGSHDEGWTMHWTVGVIYSDMESDDRLMATLYAGKKKLEEARCSALRANRSATHAVDFNDRKKDKTVIRFKCNIKKRHKKAGDITIEYKYRSADAEKTFKLEKKSVNIIRGKTAFYTDPAHLVGPVFVRYALPSKDAFLRFQITTHVSTPYSGQKYLDKNPVLRCKRDGVKVSTRNQGTLTFNVTASPREMKVYEVRFEGYWLLPDYTGEGADEDFQSFSFGQSPGDYSCRISVGGETVRRFDFAIEDRKLIASKCAKALGLEANVGIIDKSKASKDHLFKAKSARKRFFYSTKKLPKGCKKIL